MPYLNSRVTHHVQMQYIGRLQKLLYATSNTLLILLHSILEIMLVLYVDIQMLTGLVTMVHEGLPVDMCSHLTTLRFHGNLLYRKLSPLHPWKQGMLLRLCVERRQYGSKNVRMISSWVMVLFQSLQITWQQLHWQRTTNVLLKQHMLMYLTISLAITMTEA